MIYVQSMDLNKLGQMLGLGYCDFLVEDALSELNVCIFFNFLKKKSLLFLNLVITVQLISLHTVNRLLIK